MTLLLVEAFFLLPLIGLVRSFSNLLISSKAERKVDLNILNFVYTPKNQFSRIHFRNLSKQRVIKVSEIFANSNFNYEFDKNYYLASKRNIKKAIANVIEYSGKDKAFWIEEVQILRRDKLSLLRVELFANSGLNILSELSICLRESKNAKEKLIKSSEEDKTFWIDQVKSLGEEKNMLWYIKEELIGPKTKKINVESIDTILMPRKDIGNQYYQ